MFSVSRRAARRCRRRAAAMAAATFCLVNFARECSLSVHIQYRLPVLFLVLKMAVKFSFVEMVVQLV